MSIIIEDYSPISAGDTLIPFAPVFQHKDGTPVNLTGATITMKMQNFDTHTIKTCDPTQWTIDDATNGLAHYQWQTADVSASGTWTLYITVTIGGLPVHTDTKELIINSTI